MFPPFLYSMPEYQNDSSYVSTGRVSLVYEEPVTEKNTFHEIPKTNHRKR